MNRMTWSETTKWPESELMCEREVKEMRQGRTEATLACYNENAELFGGNTCLGRHESGSGL